MARPKLVASRHDADGTANSATVDSASSGSETATSTADTSKNGRPIARFTAAFDHSTVDGDTGAVSMSQREEPSSDTDAAVVILVDCSGSMDYPKTKINGAREATAAAIDALRDGTAFAVVAGTHEARDIYPGDGTLATASPSTREQAKESLRRLTAAGGTAMGTWLAKADKLFLTRRDIAIRHAILLTDGNNEHESAEDLARNIERVTGHFTADCRGVGTDWRIDELRKISSALLGTTDIVAEPSGLAEDFRSMMTGAMGK